MFWFFLLKHQNRLTGRHRINKFLPTVAHIHVRIVYWRLLQVRASAPTLWTVAARYLFEAEGLLDLWFRTRAPVWDLSCGERRDEAEHHNVHELHTETCRDVCDAGTVSYRNPHNLSIKSSKMMLKKVRKDWKQPVPFSDLCGWMDGCSLRPDPEDVLLLGSSVLLFVFHQLYFRREVSYWLMKVMGEIPEEMS